MASQMNNRTMGWDVVQGVLLVVHARGAPDTKEWARFIQECRSLGKVECCLVVAPDAALNPVQRRDIAAVVSHMKTRKVAVVTTSRMARTIVTGLGWVTGIHRGFLPGDRQGAVTFLELDERRADAVLARADALADMLGRSILSATDRAV